MDNTVAIDKAIGAIVPRANNHPMKYRIQLKKQTHTPIIGLVVIVPTAANISRIPRHRYMYNPDGIPISTRGVGNVIS